MCVLDQPSSLRQFTHFSKLIRSTVEDCFDHSLLSFRKLFGPREGRIYSIFYAPGQGTSDEKIVRTPKALVVQLWKAGTVLKFFAGTHLPHSTHRASQADNRFWEVDSATIKHCTVIDISLPAGGISVCQCPWSLPDVT